VPPPARAEPPQPPWAADGRADCAAWVEAWQQARRQPEPPRQAPAEWPRAQRRRPTAPRRVPAVSFPAVVAVAGAACGSRSDRAPGPDRTRTAGPPPRPGSARPADWRRAPRAVQAAPVPPEAAADSWRAPRHFRGCWCSAPAGSSRGRTGSGSWQVPAAPCGSRHRCSRPQTARAQAWRSNSRRAPRTVADCCRSGRSLPVHPTSTAWQPSLPHCTQTPPPSDALLPATRPPLPAPLLRATMRIRCSTHNRAKVRPRRGTGRRIAGNPRFWSNIVPSNAVKGLVRRT
jgi:hypothetical protein